MAALAAAAGAVRAAGHDHTPVTDPALSADRVGALADVLYELGSTVPDLSVQLFGLDPDTLDRTAVAEDLTRVHALLRDAWQAADIAHQTLTGREPTTWELAP